MAPPQAWSIDFQVEGWVVENCTGSMHVKRRALNMTYELFRNDQT